MMSWPFANLLLLQCVVVLLTTYVSLPAWAQEEEVKAHIEIDSYLPKEYVTPSGQQQQQHQIQACVNELRMGQNPLLSNECDVSNIILFDGVCNLCNAWVDIILQVDEEGKFRFCALQSDTGRYLLERMGRNPDDISTIVLIKSLSTREVYFKSKAVLKVMQQTSLPLRVLSSFGLLIPTALRDAVYDAVAANRYKLLGKREECRSSHSNKDTYRFIT